MQIITNTISLAELKQMAQSLGGLVKAVVDIEKEIMAVDAELQADEESLLLANGSNNDSLWGINIYPDLTDDSWLEFDSMINLRPQQNNLSRGIGNPVIREKIKQVVNKLVPR